MKKLKSSILIGLFSSALLLTSCGNNNSQQDSSNSSASESQQQSNTQSTSSQSSGDQEGRVIEVGDLASGQFNYSTLHWKEKSKILASLETYALRNHTAGIPLYDDASYEQFSQRAMAGLPSQKYLTNYGFGVGYGDFKGSRLMYNGDINEPKEEWKDYFHGYTSTDSGTFNGWNATGADVSDRMSMISSNYFGVKANEDNTAYSWIGSLSVTDAPIMLDSWDNPKVVTDYEEEDVSQFWRVKVHFGDGYTYRTAETSKFKSAYDGRKVALEDYLTPFKAMLDNKLVRASEMISDTGGFQGALDYYYLTSKTDEAWSKVGIRLNPNEGAIEFAFIQPQSMNRARTSLSSMLYSPVPADFLKDIGGAENYGKIGSDDGSHERVFDNMLSFGAYIPEYWEQGKEIVYKKNNTYFEASDYHYAGYTEVVFEGEEGSKNAYKAFQNNQLDQVSIPVEELKEHKNDANVLRTEGSTIIKLNVNSTTETEWQYYFGPNGTISTHTEKESWATKAIMSDSDFLDGVYFCIDRAELADAAGRNPATGYLSNAYMLDPTGTASYRSSEAGKSVLAEYEEEAGNECYSKDIAQFYFKRCAERLVANGTYDKGDEIFLRAVYRYQTTINNLGNYIKTYIEDAFNTAQDLLTVHYVPEVGGTSYTDTYTRMDNGEFDLAEGAIQGNVLNPLEFMNTLSTNKALNNGFNLNGGHRTDVIYGMNEDFSLNNEVVVYPCVYTDPTSGEDLYWSYDALWNASQGFIPVDDGVATPVGSNQHLEDNGDSVRYVAEFSPSAVDEDGNIVYDFEIHDFAIISSKTTGGFDGGYYVNVKFSNKPVKDGGNVSDDAYFFIDVPKSEITRIAADVAKSNGTQKYFSFYFTVVYTTKLSDNTVIKKSLNINLGGKLTDFGMEDQSGN